MANVLPAPAVAPRKILSRPRRSSGAAASTRGLLACLSAVKCEVHLEDVDIRFAENPESPSVNMVLHERAHLARIESASVGDSIDLQQRVGHGDVRVETGEVGSHRIDWDLVVGAETIRLPV